MQPGCQEPLSGSQRVEPVRQPPNPGPSLRGARTAAGGIEHGGAIGHFSHPESPAQRVTPSPGRAESGDRTTGSHRRLRQRQTRLDPSHVDDLVERRSAGPRSLSSRALRHPPHHRHRRCREAGNRPRRCRRPPPVGIDGVETVEQVAGSRHLVQARISKRMIPASSDAGLAGISGRRRSLTHRGRIPGRPRLVLAGLLSNPPDTPINRSRSPNPAWRRRLPPRVPRRVLPSRRSR